MEALAGLRAALDATPRTAPKWMHKFQVLLDLPGAEQFAAKMVEWDCTRGTATIPLAPGGELHQQRRDAERMIRRAGFCPYMLMPLDTVLWCQWTVWEFEESETTYLDFDEFLRLSEPDAHDDMPADARVHAEERQKRRTEVE